MGCQRSHWQVAWYVHICAKHCEIVFAFPNSERTTPRGVHVVVCLSERLQGDCFHPRLRISHDSRCDQSLTCNGLRRMIHGTHHHRCRPTRTRIDAETGEGLQPPRKVRPHQEQEQEEPRLMWMSGEVDNTFDTARTNFDTGRTTSVLIAEGSVRLSERFLCC